MTERDAIAGFLAERTIALVGASRHARSFSSAVRRELESQGTRVLKSMPLSEKLLNMPLTGVSSWVVSA